MVKKSLAVHLNESPEAMPVAMLVQIAGRFDSSVYLDCGNRRINAKSIMGMMTLGLCDGMELAVTADGADEEKALEEICAYLCNG